MIDRSRNISDCTWKGLLATGLLACTACSGTSDDVAMGSLGGAAGSLALDASVGDGHAKGGAAGIGGGGACGSGGGTDSGVEGSSVADGGGSDPCASMCAARVAACAPGQGESEADCINECHLSRSKYSMCVSEWDSAMTCAGGADASFVCSEKGLASMSGCDDALAATAACSACVMFDSDDFCDLCRKENCCAAFTSFWSTPDPLGYSGCASACTTTECFDQCSTSHPAEAAALDGLMTCSAAKCAASCSGAASEESVQSDDLFRYCERQAASGCSSAPPVKDCIDLIRDADQMYNGWSCALSMWLSMACAATSGFTCDTDGGVMADAQCLTDNCSFDDVECAQYLTPDGRCGLGCIGWFGSCSPKPGGTALDCECVAGPKAGFLFTAQNGCSSPDTLNLIESTCKP